MERYSLRGIEHVAGFKLLKNFMGWPAAVRLPFMTLLLLVAVGVPWSLGATNVDSILLLAAMIISGAVIGVMVILAMGAEEDLLTGDAGTRADELAASSGFRIVEPVAGFVYGLFTVTYATSIFDSTAFHWLQIFSPDYYVQSLPGAIMNQWLVVLVLIQSGMMTVYAIGFSVRQIGLFSRWADNVTIDLIHIEDLQCFSLQPLRYLLITVLFASLNIIVYQVFSVLNLAHLAFMMQVMLVLGMLLLGIPLLGPVRIVHRRIASAKKQELLAIREALGGNRSPRLHRLPVNLKPLT